MVSVLFAEVAMAAVMRAHFVPDLIAWVTVAVAGCWIVVVLSIVGVVGVVQVTVI